MKGISDQYYSRLLAIAKENKNIRSIRNIEDNQIEAEMVDGSIQIFEWDEVINYKNLVNKI